MSTEKTNIKQWERENYGEKHDGSGYAEGALQDSERQQQFKDRNPLFLGLPRAASIAMADIVRACQIKSDIEFIAVSSYQNGTSSSGVVQITHDLQQDITGRGSWSLRISRTPAIPSTSSRTISSQRALRA